MNVKLDKAAVLITAHQQALLTQPDPSIAKKGLLRVPLGEGEIGYSAADWTNCWRMGAIDFSDEYALSHHGRQPDEAHLKKIGDYLYVNRLDPASVQNWQTAYSRLSAAGVIQDITWQEIANAMPVKDKPQAPKFIDIEKMPSRTPEERRKLRDANWHNLMVESQPVVDAFFADLNSRGKYPTYDERLAMQTWVQNHNLFPNQIRSWQKALANVTPQYLNEDERLSREIDLNDSITSADLKKALGTASPRVGFTVSNKS